MITSGTLLYTGKRGDHTNIPSDKPGLSLDGWWHYANAIGVLIGLALCIALLLFEGARDDVTGASVKDKGVVEVLVPALNGASEVSPDRRL